MSIDTFMHDKVATPVAQAFPNVSPQQVGLEVLYAAAVIMIVRAASVGIFVGGSWMDSQDIFGALLFGLGIMAFVFRRRGIAESAASIAAGGPPIEVARSVRIGWTLAALFLLIFNLLFIFPGALYYTMHVVAFFAFAVAAYLQGMPPKMNVPAGLDSVAPAPAPVPYASQPQD